MFRFRHPCRRFGFAPPDIPPRVNHRPAPSAVRPAAVETRGPAQILTMSDIPGADTKSVLRRAVEMKTTPDLFQQAYHHRVVAFVTDAPSIRTELSFQAALMQLGAHAMRFNLEYYANDIHGATLPEVGDICGTYADLVVCGMQENRDLMTFRDNCPKPIVNAEDSRANPCQTLADLMTIEERKGDLAGLKIAYLGDVTRNSAQDLMRAGCALSMQVMMAANPSQPSDYPENVPQALRDESEALSAQGPGCAVYVDSVEAAVREADVIYVEKWVTYDASESTEGATETWANGSTPMLKAEPRMTLQEVESMIDTAAPNVLFMHCLPSRRLLGSAAPQIEGSESIFRSQVVNRLYVQKSLLVHMLAARSMT